MTDYGRIHAGVPYFGIWASETMDDFGRQDAVLVLRGAVDCCTDDDMRENREVIAALDYLTRQGHGKRTRAFRRALDVQHPAERQQAAIVALKAIQDSVTDGTGNRRH